MTDTVPGQPDEIDDDPDELGLPPEHRHRRSRSADPREAGSAYEADANIPVPRSVQLATRAFDLLMEASNAGKQLAPGWHDEVERWRTDFNLLLIEEQKRYEES
jgi:hypothetical protein